MTRPSVRKSELKLPVHSTMMSTTDFFPPWPPWEDTFLNNTKWLGESRAKSESFEEPISHGVLPDYMPVASWQRLSEVHKEASLTLEAESEPPDLISNNQHLFQYRIMRLIISSIACLERIGSKSSFPVEYQSGSYMATGDPRWKPWDHVYALTRGGRGQTHRPQYNRYGMYYIRLFNQGKWRRITVDDYLPYDAEGQLLLPGTKNRFNMWPYLLTKGLLRIASQSWTPYDDSVDFNVIASLTGWICHKIDASNATKEELWPIFHANLLEKAPTKEDLEREVCLTTESLTCIHDDSYFYCWEPETRYMLVLFPETSENELKDMSPSKEHYVHLTKATELQGRQRTDVPEWKRLRWLDWALDKGLIDVRPGTYMRHLDLFSPLCPMKTVIQLQSVSNESVQSIIENEKSEVKPERVFQLKDPEKNETDETFRYTFGQLFPYLKRLEIYYKTSYFEHSFCSNDLVMDLKSSPSLEPEPSKMKTPMKGIPIRHSHIDKDPTDRTVNFFYLYSDTQYCKNIYVTLSTSDGVEDSPNGYLICEQFDWRSETLGKIIFCLQTAGTKTTVIYLGVGMQIRRFWCSFPGSYSVAFHSKSEFRLLDSVDLFEILSIPSSQLAAIGGKMGHIFNGMLASDRGSDLHCLQLDEYKAAFNPPLSRSLPKSLQLDIAFEINNVLEDAIIELIFDRIYPLEDLVFWIDNMKSILLKPQFGDRFLKCKKRYLKKHINKIRKAIAKEVANLEDEDANRRTKSLVKGIGEKSSKAGINEPCEFLQSSENNIFLMRKVLQKQDKFCLLYPFINDLGQYLKYHDYEKTTIINPNHEWALLARFVLNIHSTVPVPCAIHLTTRLKRAMLSLYDLDANNLVPIPINVHGTYHLRKNKVGYAILIHVFPEKDWKRGDKSEMPVSWRLRVAGVDYPNVLHFCSLRGNRLCRVLLTNPPDFVVHKLTGYYFPNEKNIISRFVITISDTVLITLRACLNNPDVSFRLRLKGRQDMILAEAEGTGAITVPIVLLEMENARLSSTLPLYTEISSMDGTTSLFRGELELIGFWNLDRDEKNVIKNLKKSSQYYIIAVKEEEDEDRRSIPSGDRIRKGSKLIAKEVTNEEKVDERKEDGGSEKKLQPYWKIRMIVDEPVSSKAQLDHDRFLYYAYEITKKIWKQKDPEREKRGKKLRDDFLNEDYPNLIRIIRALQGGLMKEVAERPSHLVEDEQSLPSVHASKTESSATLLSHVSSRSSRSVVSLLCQLLTGPAPHILHTVSRVSSCSSLSSESLLSTTSEEERGESIIKGSGVELVRKTSWSVPSLTSEGLVPEPIVSAGSLGLEPNKTSLVQMNQEEEVAILADFLSILSISKYGKAIVQDFDIDDVYDTEWSTTSEKLIQKQEDVDMEELEGEIDSGSAIIFTESVEEEQEGRDAALKMPLQKLSLERINTTYLALKKEADETIREAFDILQNTRLESKSRSSKAKVY